LIDSTSPADCTSYPYIYGIIPANEHIIFDITGIDNADDVYTIRHAGLSAVISDVGVSDFQGMSRPVALQRLAAHQRVLEAVMHDYPVLPVKFGTILSDEAGVHSLLAQGAALFTSALEQFADKCQIEVVVLWELPKVFAAIGAEPEIVAMKAKIGSQPTEASLAERVVLGQLAQSALERRRAVISEQAIAMIEGVARDMVINPMMDDSMVVNLALLLDKSQAGELDEQLQRLDGALDGQFQIRCVGPLPPYSFATVAVQAFSFDAINEAQRQLELDDAATGSEIKHRYRALAALVHPDHNAHDDDAEARMTALTRAYKLLSMYAESQTRPPGSLERHKQHERRCWFNRDSVERTLLISISRQDAAQEPVV
jgi:hypothetical protein